MRKSYRLLFFLLLVSPLAWGQRKVIVPEGFATLNEIIRKDTIAGGQRKDPGTVYVLRRGGVYVLSGTILTSGFDLRLEAEEGNGPRPYVVMGFLEGGTQVEEVFEVRGNLTMRGLYLTAVNELNTYIARVISASASNIRLSFYDCVIDGSGQTFVRINSPGCKVYMLNTTISRMGRPSNPDNGRVIDDRGNQIDSIVVENNTWYNVTSRIVRDGGAEINYVRLNQNTFVNVGQRLAAIGPVNTFIFTNNVVVSPRFFGNSTTSSIVSLEFAPFGSTPFINLNYNNIYYEPEVVGAWATVTAGGSIRIEPPFVAPANQAIFNSAIGIRKEVLTFTTRPTPPTEFIIQSELANSSTIPDWDWTGAISSTPWELGALAYHNFSYPTSSPSFTGSATGEPLGDLRWFPSFDVAWTLRDLIRQAQALVARESSNPVVGSNPALLAALQSAVTAAQSVANNGASTGSQIAAQRNNLQQAMNDFRASLVITSVEEKGISNVYPNPVTTEVFVRVTEESWSYEILGADGRTWATGVIQGPELIVETGSLPSGLFILRLRTANRFEVHKLIKK